MGDKGDAEEYGNVIVVIECSGVIVIKEIRKDLHPLS